MSSIAEKVGLRILHLRKGHRLSQVALAEKCGIRQNTLSKIERGQMSASLETLESLANALGVTEAEILTFTGTSGPTTTDAVTSIVATLPEDAEALRARLKLILLAAIGDTARHQV